MPGSDPESLRRIVAQLYTSDVGAKIIGIDVAQAYLAGSADLQWGGDVSDIFQFGDGRTAFLVADVSGKGLQAAQQTSLIKYSIRAYASLGLEPGLCLQSLNTLYAQTCAFEGRESFASIFFGLIDQKRETMVYASGGHDPALLLRSSGEIVTLKPAGPLIGVVEGVGLFEQHEVDLAPNDSLICFTDGVTDARDSGGELLGFDGALAIVADNAQASAYEQARTLLASLRARCGGNYCNDDIAILALRIRADSSVGSSALVSTE